MSRMLTGKIRLGNTLSPSAICHRMKLVELAIPTSNGTRENTMRPIRIPLNHRLTGEPFDARVGQLACILAGTAILPVAVVALVRHPGSQADFLLGLGLAALVSLLCVMLGVLCRHSVGLGGKVALRSRWPEFAGYFVCVGTLITGVLSLAGLGLTPAQVTLGLLLICSLSLAILVLGMLTSVICSLKR